MSSTVDEGRGLTRVFWCDVRERVRAVEPHFAELVDALSPDNQFPLYLAYYPYGAKDADTESSLFPNAYGGYYRITDTDAPKDVVTDLGYSAHNTPLGMVLEKEVECFIDLKSQGVTIPWLVYTPGKLFPFTRLFRHCSRRMYEPNGLLSSTAGARSVFLLPSIGCATHHANLQRDFNVQASPPKRLYDHGELFRELVSSKEVETDWRCCIMYFSAAWVESIVDDPAWSKLKYYLHELAWVQSEYARNKVYYDITFSMIQKGRNLRPNPYLADTAKHLFAAAIGSAPGYAPAMDNASLPLDVLERIFVESYGMKKYYPTIMRPVHFNFEQDVMPVYYSLQNSCMPVFSPKSREVASTLFEMRELEYLIRIFQQELCRQGALSSDTILGDVAQSINFQFYHNKADRHRIVQSSSLLPVYDTRFTTMSTMKPRPEARFASDAPFVRGCVRISRHDAG